MATLKISDLSVGDWVSFDTAYLTVEGDDIATAFVKKVQQPARIKSILGDQDLIFAEVETEDNFDTIYLKMEHIRPIPITAEILENDGWKKEGRSYRWSNEKYRVFIWLKKFSHFVDVVEMDKQFATKSSCIEVSQLHVHQLQHALRLAGVDKEINL